MLFCACTEHDWCSEHNVFQPCAAGVPSLKPAPLLASSDSGTPITPRTPDFRGVWITTPGSPIFPSQQRERTTASQGASPYRTQQLVSRHVSQQKPQPAKAHRARALQISSNDCVPPKYQGLAERQALFLARQTTNRLHPDHNMPRLSERREAQCGLQVLGRQVGICSARMSPPPIMPWLTQVCRSRAIATATFPAPHSADCRHACATTPETVGTCGTARRATAPRVKSLCRYRR